MFIRKVIFFSEIKDSDGLKEYNELGESDGLNFFFDMFLFEFVLLLLFNGFIYSVFFGLFEFDFFNVFVLFFVLFRINFDFVVVFYGYINIDLKIEKFVLSFLLVDRDIYFLVNFFNL